MTEILRQQMKLKLFTEIFAEFITNNFVALIMPHTLLTTYQPQSTSFSTKNEDINNQYDALSRK